MQVRASRGKECHCGARYVTRRVSLRFITDAHELAAFVCFLAAGAFTVLSGYVTINGHMILTNNHAGENGGEAHCSPDHNL